MVYWTHSRVGGEWITNSLQNQLNDRNNLASSISRHPLGRGQEVNTETFCILFTNRNRRFVTRAAIHQSSLCTVYTILIVIEIKNMHHCIQNKPISAKSLLGDTDCFPFKLIGHMSECLNFYNHNVCIIIFLLQMMRDTIWMQKWCQHRVRLVLFYT